MIIHMKFIKQALGEFNTAEIFARVLFLRNGEIILLFTDIGQSCPSRNF